MVKLAVLLCIFLGGCAVSPTQPSLNHDLNSIERVEVDPNIKALPYPGAPPGITIRKDGETLLAFDKQGIDELRQLKHVAISNTETLDTALVTVEEFADQYNTMVAIAQAEQQNHNDTKIKAAEADTRARQEELDLSIEVYVWRFFVALVAIAAVL